MTALQNRKRRDVLLFLACAVALVGILVLWLAATSNERLRDELRHWQLWALFVQSLMLVISTLVSLPALVRRLAIRRRDLVVPVAAAVLAAGLVAGVAPRTNRIFYDEQIYQSVGQNLSALGLAQMCNDGGVDDGVFRCSRGEYSKEPYGYPYLLSLVYHVTGVRERVAFGVNIAAAAAMVLVVYLLTVALTARREAGQVAALVVALIPEHLRWSHTAAVEPTAALMCAVAILAVVAFAEIGTTSALVWAVSGSAFAVQFRQESILVLPLMALVIALLRPAEIRRLRLWWAALAGVALLSVHIGHLVAVRGEHWGTDGPRISLQFLSHNLATNGPFYVTDWRFPVLFTALVVVALLRWTDKRRLLVPLTYFLAFWGIYLVFYAGSYSYGADDRFSLMTFAPLAVLAGMGGAAIISDAGRFVSRGKTQIAILAVIAAQFVWYVPVVKVVGEEAWAARADVDFAREAAARLPPHSMIFTHNPNMFHVWGESAVQTSIGSGEPAYVRTVLKSEYPGGIYFHWNFWCDVPDAVQQAFCTGLLSQFPHTLVSESAVRDFKYAIYKLDVD